MAKTLEYLLREQGATDQQINTKTFQMCENAIAEMGDDQIKASSLVRAQELTEKLKDAEAAYSVAKIETKKMYQLLREADSVCDNLKSYIDNIKPSNETSQALLIYSSVLKETKEVFGEQITEEVMKAAIEAGSYGMWRSIMGESKPFDSGRRRY